MAHTFSLVNKGNTPVKIVELKTSCGCLVASRDEGLGATTVAPGDTFALPIRFTTAGAQETASGRVMVGYRKVSDAPDSGPLDYVSVRVRADVVPDYRISPREVDFGVIDGLAVQQVSRTIRVVPVAATDMEIRQVATSSKFVSTQLLPNKDDNHGFEIKVGLDASQFTQSRSFTGTIVLSTTSERLPKAIVRVRAKYQAVAEAEPSMIVIGSDERGEVQRQLRMTTSRPARVHGIRCSADDGRVRVEFSRRQAAREHLIQVFLAPCRERALNCELEIEFELFTDDGKSIVRTLGVSVHRFLEKGVEND